MKGQQFKLRVAGFILLLVLLGCHLALLTTEFFPVDDAYISFRYAANLADGEGLVFNLGERVEGYSNFLFVVVLAGLSELGITPPLAARWINLISVISLLAYLVFGRSLRSSQRIPVGLGLLAGLYLVLSPHTALNVLSGLETPATAALLGAGVIFLSRDRPRAAAISFLLVALNRPEGIVLALGAAAWDLWRGREQLRSRIFWWASLLVAPYTLFFVWRVVYYGSPLPSSVRAKSGSPTDWHFEQTLSYMARAVESYWPLMILALAGWLISRARSSQPRAAWWLLLGVTGLCLLTGSGDPYRTLLRYLYPGLPLLLIVASASAQAWWQFATTLARPRRIFLTASVALMLASQLAVLAYQASFEIMRKENFKALARVGVQAKMLNGFRQIFAQDHAPHTSELGVAIGQHDLARWLLDHAESDDILVSSQVGIAPYYTGLYVLDTFGLVTRRIADLPGPPGAKKAPDFIFGQAPEFITFKKNPKLQGGIAADVRLLRDVRLRRDYDLVRIFDLGGPRLLLFQRRSQPVLDIAYDFVQRFSKKQVGKWRNASWHAVGPKNKLAVAMARVQFVGKHRQQKLRRQLAAVSRGEGADFEGAEAMRQWLGQWRGWIEHRPAADAPTSIRFRLEIPEKAFLRFGLGAPPLSRKPSTEELASFGKVRYSILVEDADGERHEVFSSIPTPRRGPGRKVEVDLRAYAGQKVTLYFLADRVSKGRGRFGWIEPLLIRRGDWDATPSDAGEMVPLSDPG